MKPYYQDDWATIWHGDCREILPTLDPMDMLLTDPVWPNAKAQLVGRERPFELLSEALQLSPVAKRIILQFGCDSDPRILLAVPKTYPFFRLVSLEYACAFRKGRLLYTGDVAYVFGIPPKSAPGRRVMPGRYCSTKSDAKRTRLTPHKEYGVAVAGEHPCPRRLQHVQYLVGRWADGTIVDPFVGSGTTLLAAKTSGYKSIGIEIEERYCEIAARRLSQEVLALQ